MLSFYFEYRTKKTFSCSITWLCLQQVFVSIVFFFFPENYFISFLLFFFFSSPVLLSLLPIFPSLFDRPHLLLTLKWLSDSRLIVSKNITIEYCQLRLTLSLSQPHSGTHPFVYSHTHTYIHTHTYTYVNIYMHTKLSEWNSALHHTTAFKQNWEKSQTWTDK